MMLLMMMNTQTHLCSKCLPFHTRCGKVTQLLRPAQAEAAAKLALEHLPKASLGVVEAEEAQRDLILAPPQSSAAGSEGSSQSSGALAAKSAAPSAAPSENDGSSSVGGRQRKYSRGAIADRRKDQADKYQHELSPYKALKGESMKNAYYQAKRTLDGLFTLGLQEGSEYLQLQAQRSFVQLCEKMSALPTLMPSEQREADLAMVISQVSPLPEEFQLTILQTRVKELVLNTEQAVDEWLAMVDPRVPAAGLQLQIRRNVGKYACNRLFGVWEANMSKESEISPGILRGHYCGFRGSLSF